MLEKITIMKKRRNIPANADVVISTKYVNTFRGYFEYLKEHERFYVHKNVVKWFISLHSVMPKVLRESQCKNSLTSTIKEK